MVWLFLHALVIFSLAILMVLGVVSLEQYRRRVVARKARKQALTKAEPVFSEYKYVYRNIKED